MEIFSYPDYKTFNYNTFKNISDLEIRGVISVLNELLSEYDYFSSHYDANAFFGLCYTSTSALPGLYVSSNIEYDGYKVNCFAITDNNQLIMICYDEEEREKFYGIDYN